jgi:alkanesulfonate monooxygenase SsuD/methylene tetrahydromethanopterin reductase-like flavin-dependent oxidoreductase (luciferase family)
MLEMAAEVADGVILPFLRTDEYLRERALSVKARAPRARVVCEVIAGVGDTAEAGANRLQRWLRYITKGPSYPGILAQAGLRPSEITDYLAAESATLPVSAIQALAVVGTPHDCAQAIARRILPWCDEAMVVSPGRHLSGAVAVANELDLMLGRRAS